MQCGSVQKLGKRLNGEITVFLSLIITCICALMGTLLESARVAADGWYLRTALYSSLDSLMSQYHRDVWEQYHLFLLEYEDEKGLEQELKSFLSPYFERQNFYRLNVSELSVPEVTKITDQGGIHFEREILDYMKTCGWKERFLKDPDKLEAECREAEQIGTVTELYHVNTRKLLKLERSIEAIEESLEKQEQYLNAGQEKLEDLDGSGFLKTAEKMKKEMKQIPKLLREYEKRAEELSKALDESEQEADLKKGEITKEHWDLISSEWQHYRSYSEKEGERYQKILSLEPKTQKNLSVLEDAVNEAEETLEYIDNWESDDDDDELDEEALWNAVLRSWKRIDVKKLSDGSRIKDKKSMKVLEKISGLIGTDLLSFVLPEGTQVSKAAAASEQFPSYTAGGMQRSEIKDTALLKNDCETNSVQNIKKLADRVAVNEYLGVHFTNFLSEASGEENGIYTEKKQDGKKKFIYEQEYILSGASSDYRNLKETVNRLLKIRSASNFIYLLKDPVKRGEAEKLAAAITGSACLLLPVTVTFILMVWAFGEALIDVKILFAQGNVPFVKNSEDWHLSLEELLHFNLKEAASGGKTDEKRGMNYNQYLKILFLIQPDQIKEYRMMDMIQKNITEKQQGFLMTQGLVGLRAECGAKGIIIPIRRKAVRSYEDFE